MRIKSLAIKNHPILGSFNYPDFDTQTERRDIATYFIGPNGSGKSFLFEVIVDVFDSVINKKKVDYLYTLSIVHKGVEAVYSNDNKGAKQKRISVEPNKKELIPENVLFYYSGETKRSRRYFIDYWSKHRQKLLKNENVDFPSFFYVDTELVPLVLFSLIVYEEGTKNLRNLLDIESIGYVDIKVKPQDWYKIHFKDNDSDASHKFWGAKGSVGEFMEFLEAASIERTTQAVKVKSGFDSDGDYNFITNFRINAKDFSLLRKKDTASKDFFTNLINAWASGIIEDFNIPIVKKKSKRAFNYNGLSEGEKQILLTLGFIAIMQSERTLFLLDEPDTHLNPIWKYKFQSILSGNLKTNLDLIEFFIATHDPLLISGLQAENVVMVSKENDNLRITQAPEDLMGKGVEAILTSDLFGLTTTLDYDTNSKVVERRKLMAKALTGSLSNTELNRLEKLTEKLRGLDFTLPYNDPEFIDYLSQLDAEKLATYTQPFTTSAQYSVRQKLKNIFKPKP